jgi:hypothetical protein
VPSSLTVLRLPTAQTLPFCPEGAATGSLVVPLAALCSQMDIGLEQGTATDWVDKMEAQHEHSITHLGHRAIRVRRCFESATQHSTFAN